MSIDLTQGSNQPNITIQLEGKAMSLSDLSLRRSTYSERTTSTQSMSISNEDILLQLANAKKITSGLDGKLFAVYSIEKSINPSDVIRSCTVKPIKLKNNNRANKESGLTLSFGDSSAFLANLKNIPAVIIQPKVLYQLFGNYKADVYNNASNSSLDLPKKRYKVQFHVPTQLMKFKRTNLKDKFIVKIKVIDNKNDEVYKYSWVYDENSDCWLLKTPLHFDLILARFFNKKHKLGSRLEFYIKFDLHIRWILLTIIGFIVYN